MIKVKHFLDDVENDDGQRIWVEPIGLTGEFREWCKVDHVLQHFGPPKALWEWFEEHPDGYEHFRGAYHEALQKSAYRPAMVQLARASVHENFTLLHQADDGDHNSASALHEFLSELSAWSLPE